MLSSNWFDRLTHLPGVASAVPGAIVSLAVLSLAGYGEHALRARLNARPRTHTAATTTPAVQHTHISAAVWGGHCASGHGFCVADAMCAPSSRCVPEAEVSRALNARRSAAPREDAIPLMPSLAWNGSGYGIVWASLREEEADIYFARIDPVGRRVGAPARVSSGAGLKVLPRLAWTGNGYGVVWTQVNEGESADVYLARLSTVGTVQGQPTRLSRGGSFEFGGDLVWNSSGYGVAWMLLDTDYQMTLRFGRYSPTGERVGELRTVHRGFVATGVPAMTWTGDGYGVGWNTFTPRDEKSTTLLARIPGSGQGGSVDRVAQGEGLAGTVSLAWNGSQQGMAWEDDLDFESDEDPKSALMFAAVGSGGNVARRPITQRDSLSVLPSLAWATGAYGLAWTEIGGGNLRVLFQRLSREGATQGTALPLNTGIAALMPTLRWNGQEWAAAWVDVGRSAIDLCVSRVSSSGQRVGAVSCIGAK